MLTCPLWEAPTAAGELLKSHDLFHLVGFWWQAGFWVRPLTTVQVCWQLQMFHVCINTFLLETFHKVFFSVPWGGLHMLTIGISETSQEYFLVMLVIIHSWVCENDNMIGTEVKGVVYLTALHTVEAIARRSHTCPFRSFWEAFCEFSATTVFCTWK